jgi:C4-dicarboxylate-specific signal transduction histidine kinase
MRLAVEVEEAILQEARVFIEVEDSGPGIAAEMLDWVFEPFFTTKGEEHGTGLGLAICRNIAVEYGGNILVSTEAGAGTSLVLFLPF